MPRKFRKDRLLELADIMEKVEPHQYKQNLWLEVDHLDDLKLTEKPYTQSLGNDYVRVCLPEGFCGTAACVLGQAAICGKFGLDVIRNKYASGRSSFDIAYRGDKKVPVYNQEAGAKAFGIPSSHASVLFSGPANAFPFYNDADSRYSYGKTPTPQQVAKRLREYAENPKIIEKYL